MSLFNEPDRFNHTTEDELLKAVERRVEVLTNNQRGEVSRAVERVVGYRLPLVTVSVDIFSSGSLEWAIIDNELNWRPSGGSYNAWRVLRQGDLVSLKKLQWHLNGDVQLISSPETQQDSFYGELHTHEGHTP